MEREISAFILGLIFGCILGIFLLDYANTKKLNMVGIERIEKCHNVNSKWCEIVWMKK